MPRRTQQGLPTTSQLTRPVAGVTGVYAETVFRSELDNSIVNGPITVRGPQQVAQLNNCLGTIQQGWVPGLGQATTRTMSPASRNRSEAQKRRQAALRIMGRNEASRNRSEAQKRRQAALRAAKSEAKPKVMRAGHAGA